MGLKIPNLPVIGIEGEWLHDKSIEKIQKNHIRKFPKPRKELPIQEQRALRTSNIQNQKGI